MSGSRRYSTGLVIAGQQEAVWRPRTLTRRYAVLAFHGAAGVAAVGLDPVSTPGWYTTCLTLRDAGCLVVQADWDFAAWGGPTFLADVETFRTTKLAALATDLPNGGILDTSKVVIFSGSMGGCDGFRYQEQQPSRVAGHATVAGASDLTGYYTGTYRWTSDQGTANQAAIGAAFAVTPPAALPVNADPYDNAALITSPTMIYGSTADTTVTEAQNQAMATALGSHGTYQRVSTSAPHGDGETVAALGYGMTDWLLARAS